MIYTVLRQRHMKEAIHLEDQLARARDAALRQRLADIDKQRQDERDKLLSAFEQVITLKLSDTLLVNDVGLSLSVPETLLRDIGYM